jgi:hypothetical protein
MSGDIRIKLEERIPVVPSQYHRSRIRAASGESRPRTHVQRDASGANAEQPAGTSEGTVPSSGLVRSEAPPSLTFAASVLGAPIHIGVLIALVQGVPSTMLLVVELEEHRAR